MRRTIAFTTILSVLLCLSCYFVPAFAQQPGELKAVIIKIPSVPVLEQAEADLKKAREESSKLHNEQDAYLLEKKVEEAEERVKVLKSEIEQFIKDHPGDPIEAEYKKYQDKKNAEKSGKGKAKGNQKQEAGGSAPTDTEFTVEGGSPSGKVADKGGTKKMPAEMKVERPVADCLGQPCISP
jgi:hypothetical protein